MSDAEPTVESEAAVEIDQLKQDMEKVAAVANRLVAEDSNFAQLIASMLAARQLYAMCMYELEWLVREGDWQAKKVPELSDHNKVMLKEILINAAAVQAQQPFDENVLFRGMKQTVFPWMERVVGKHSEYQNKERRRLFEEQEKIRVETPIDLGLAIAEAPLDRQMPVLLVGEAHLLSFLFDRLIENLPDTVKQAVQLVEGKPKASAPRSVLVPLDAWKGCARSNNGFQRVYETFVLPVLSNPVDLLLVHNLLPAYTGMDFASITTRANEAQYKLKKWTNAAGALLVSGLPLDRALKANELNLPEYETLRVHNVLRGVSAVPTDSPDQLEIHVGAQIVATVSAEELNSYKKSSIVTG